MEYSVLHATSPEDIGRCQAVRRTVFVDEMGIEPAVELDGKDPQCLHFLVRYGDMTVAAARILPLGGTARIERMAVIENFRRAQVGRRLMETMLDHAAEAGYQYAILGAQLPAVGFYQKLGFEAFGPEYMDAGIKHRNMRLKLSTRSGNVAAA